MQRIAPALMFVGEQYGKAEEAMRLYVSLFERSRILEIERFGEDEAEPAVKRARFVLAGTEYSAMDSDGPHQFGFTPAISLFVDCDSEDQLDAAFAKLSEGGSVLMPLQDYPFSPRFGWVQDRFGVSWQLNLTAEESST
jgi:predicted 3-demethylubiquinone-9 3-methyltransferase (glyoxalase superfamily)